jgi:hypothetical protein
MYGCWQLLLLASPDPLGALTPALPRLALAPCSTQLTALKTGIDTFKADWDPYFAAPGNAGLYTTVMNHLVGGTQTDTTDAATDYGTASTALNAGTVPADVAILDTYLATGPANFVNHLNALSTDISSKIITPCTARTPAGGYTAHATALTPAANAYATMPALKEMVSEAAVAVGAERQCGFGQGARERTGRRRGRPAPTAVQPGGTPGWAGSVWWRAAQGAPGVVQAQKHRSYVLALCLHARLRAASAPT